MENQIMFCVCQSKSCCGLQGALCVCGGGGVSRRVHAARLYAVLSKINTRFFFFCKLKTNIFSLCFCGYSAFAHMRISVCVKVKVFILLYLQACCCSGLITRVMNKS